MYVQPAVAGELVFVGSCSGVYYAFERDSGEVRWSYDTKVDGRPATFHTNPVVTETLVITGTDGGAPGYVYAFERETGELRWKRLLEQGKISANLILVEGSVLALGSSGDLVAPDPADGEERWVFDAPSDPYRQRGSVVSHEKKVYTAGMDEAVYAVSATDGRALWRRELPAQVTSSILIAGSGLYVGTADGNLFRLDLGSGEIAARLEVGEAPGGTLVEVEDSVVFLGPAPSRKLSAADVELRGIGWVREPEKGSWTADRPILWQGLLLAGDNHGNLLALDPKDGSTRWSTELEGKIRGIGHSGDTLFVGTIGGILYAVATGLGDEQASAPDDGGMDH